MTIYQSSVNGHWHRRFGKIVMLKSLKSCFSFSEPFYWPGWFCCPAGGAAVCQAAPVLRPAVRRPLLPQLRAPGGHGPHKRLWGLPESHHTPSQQQPAGVNCSGSSDCWKPSDAPMSFHTGDREIKLDLLEKGQTRTVFKWNDGHLAIAVCPVRVCASAAENKFAIFLFLYYYFTFRGQ